MVRVSQLPAEGRRTAVGLKLGDFPAAFGFHSYRRGLWHAGNGIVAPQPLLHGFSLRQRRYSLPTRAARSDSVLGHEIVVGIVNMDDITGVGAFTVIRIRDVGVMLMLH